MKDYDLTRENQFQVSLELPDVPNPVYISQASLVVSSQEQSDKRSGQITGQGIECDFGYPVFVKQIVMEVKPNFTPNVKARVHVWSGAGFVPWYPFVDIDLKTSSLPSIQTEKILLQFGNYSEENYQKTLWIPKAISSEDGKLLSVRFEIAERVSEGTILLDDLPLVAGIPISPEQKSLELPVAILNGYLQDKYDEQENMPRGNILAGLPLQFQGNSKGEVNIECKFEYYAKTREIRESEVQKSELQREPDSPLTLVFDEKSQTKTLEIEPLFSDDKVSKDWKFEIESINLTVQAKDVMYRHSLPDAKPLAVRQPGFDLWLEEESEDECTIVLSGLSHPALPWKKVGWKILLARGKDKEYILPTVQIGKDNKICPAAAQYQIPMLYIEIPDEYGQGIDRVVLKGCHFRLPVDVYVPVKGAGIFRNGQEWNPLVNESLFLPKGFCILGIPDKICLEFVYNSGKFAVSKSEIIEPNQTKSISLNPSPPKGEPIKLNALYLGTLHILKADVKWVRKV